MAAIVGVFNDKKRAEKAVISLRNQGFEKEISIISKGEQGQGQSQQGGARQGDMEAAQEDDMGMGDISDGASWGGAIGGAAGLLAGAGALAIPGIGPIVAAGPLAAALSGVVAGGVAGSLIDLGIPEEEGQRYEDNLREGKVLAIVDTSEQRLSTAMETLHEHGAESVQTYDKGE